MINKDESITRIIFQNVNGLELTSHGHTMELICDSMRRHLIGIACLCETKKISNITPAYKLNNIVSKFWKQKKIVTSESITKWSTVYKLGRTVIITPTSLSTRVITSREDNEGLG